MKPSRSILLLLTLCIWSVLPADSSPAQPAASLPAEAINPHWKTDACDQCHTIQDGQVQPLEWSQAEQICLRCHDGIHAHAEAHPVGRPLQGEQFRNPGWPLLDGKVVCLTCHDISLTTGHKNAQSKPSDFLRPGLGKGPDAFCASCHKPVSYNRVNPHRMMTPEGQIVPADCLLCHTVVPPRNVMAPTGHPDLRTDVLDLCRSCHYYHVDWFTPGHIGAKVPPRMLAYMRAREITGPSSRPSRQMITKLETEHARPQDWPLGPGNTLICTTCHNPHQKGVFPPDSTLSRGALTIEGTRVVSPIEIPQICLRCHDM